jgi:PhnB protein
MSTKPVPDGYASVTPYLMIQGAAKAIEFYKNIFGAKERMRIPGPGGTVGHAEIEIGGSLIMLADDGPGTSIKGPLTVGGSPVCIHVYLEDSDKTFAKAIAGGATEIRPVKNQFYGDRSGMFRDPFGHVWDVATHVEDVSPEELNKRLAAMKAGG